MEGDVVIDKTVLYDSRNKEIGNIYPRRAKQLVMNGRAVWLDEGRRIKMVSSITDSSEKIKEESIMVDDGMYPTNGDPITANYDTEKTDAVLLYQAIQNVNEKKKLVRHMVAYVFAWIAMVLFESQIVQRINYSGWWNILDVIQNINQARPYIPEPYVWSVDWLVGTMDWYFRESYTHSIWYVLLGVMLAWGVWIAFCIIQRVSSPIKNKILAMYTQKARPDPIMQEYNRLKGIKTE